MKTILLIIAFGFFQTNSFSQNTITWTGAVNSNWENPGNWSGNVLPDANSIVNINAGAIVVINSDVVVASLNLNPGAKLTINPPFHMTTSNIPVVNNTTVEITVIDGNSWSVINPFFSLSVGATVSLYETSADVTNNNPKYTGVTDQTGRIKITVPDERNNFNFFYLIVQNNIAKNIYNGYLLAGIFQSQSDINSSAFQSPATVGGPKFVDANGDGRISTNDKVIADFIFLDSASLRQQPVKTVYVYK
ncbi:MAG TPA: hypothetical protein VLC98_00840 [Phnomibacter sp.]|nr:hypothetical protein [Phnomibacter sp.]